MRHLALAGTDVRETASLRAPDLAGEQYNKSHRRVPRLVRLGPPEHARRCHHELRLYSLEGAVGLSPLHVQLLKKSVLQPKLL